ncbi:MAG: sigma-70 family RNA polymerase sigma factor [Chlorobi bacterium]|nr:sigma-70 family RNA polymerase sigma factor [Chlorobiota bacterium]
MMKQRALSDAELVRKYVNGDEQSLEILINRYRHKLFGYIMNKVKDKFLAEDLFQDVFIKVIHTLKEGQYNEEGRFGSWLMRIAHNMIVDHFRKLKRNKTQYDTEDFSMFDIIPAGITAEDDMILSQTVDKIRRLIRELPEEQRQVLEMRIYDNIPFKDIAEMQEISINTALGRMRYALINLRKMMERYQIELRD